MIQDELDKMERSPSWLAKKLNYCRANGYKIIHEKKFNAVIFLMEASVITGHNFLKDLADIIEIEMELSKKTEQNV
ncbi:MAG: hypothetical protein IKQ30_05615 [Bacteroidales bacterium]|nr:hypothetical protein [Bacteroidales bacterium]MBR4272297.1 hypothetical protein [Bacteroidales bacterium]